MNRAGEGSMRVITRRGSLLAAAALLLPAAGQPPPPVVDIAITIGPAVNPGIDGRPLPVAVRLYLLTAAGKFEGADVFALIEREQATLGAELIAREELTFTPGSTRQVTREADSRTRFLGAIVLFRDIDRARWKAIQPVASTGTTRLRLDADRLEATLTPAG